MFTLYLFIYIQAKRILQLTVLLLEIVYIESSATQ